MPGYIVIDTETSGLMDYKRPADAEGQPRVAEFAAIFLDADLNVEREYQTYIKPDGWIMDPQATAINGLTDDDLELTGVPVALVLAAYTLAITEGRSVVAYGAQFDCKMMRAELRRAGLDDLFEKTPNICLMRSARSFAKQIGRDLVKAGGSNKGWPKLTDLCDFLGVPYDTEAAHGALEDARLANACFKKMVELGFDRTPEVHHAKDHDAIRNAK